MFEGTDYSNEPSAALDDLVASMYIVDRRWVEGV